MDTKGLTVEDLAPPEQSAAETTTPDKSDDAVNHPAHYGGDTVYEVIKVLKAWGLFKNALRFNTIKYLARAGRKNDLLEDLKKAIWYLQAEINEVEEQRRHESV